MRKVNLFIIDDAREEFEKLNAVVGRQRSRGIKSSEEMQLLASIKKKGELLKLNPTYGDKIPREYWPKELAERYALTNLWRVGLTNYWRMLYTLRGDKIEVVCFVIELLDHKQYDKLFKYKKK
ncbi:MAG: hypothetical protein KAW41_03550 [Candidatus Diapherotrites archaeon]|nr:hypothetical protein [Candidatus Diapherotrites archaeon]